MPRRHRSKRKQTPRGRSTKHRRSGRQGSHKIAAFSDISKFVNKAVVVETAEREAPTHLFSEFPIDQRIKDNIQHKGYIEPTPIQDRIIPHALAGKDVVGIADTGTGKTAAFLIPLINNVLGNPREKVLIITPTRELALQIEKEFNDFSKRLNMNAVSCIGGTSMGTQTSALRKKHQFVIGTPGRLKDLVGRGVIKLETFNAIVLDEADRMLDMGFIRDVRFLMAGLPEKHHTLFFSATTSSNIKHLIGTFMNNPVSVSIKTRETAASVEQDIVRIPPGWTKLEMLKSLLKEPGYDRVLVFGRTKHGVEKLARTLKKEGIKTESMHGNKSQPQRKKALALFKQGQLKAMIATDVAARGIDVDDITHVINYDLPGTHEDYVHRIGRTGRGGKKGKALTFIE